MGKNVKHFDDLISDKNLSVHIIRQGKPTVVFIVDENNKIVETRFEP